MPLPLKHYQETILDDFSDFLRRVRSTGKPATAFYDSLEAAKMADVPYKPLVGSPATPYVCLRVPTGGGKTRIAAHAIERVLKNFIASDNLLILWLVPSETIRDQTLNALKTRGEMLFEDLREQLRDVNVLTIDESLYVSHATLLAAHTIIVSTMQSFKRDTKDGLRVYRQNGISVEHFAGAAEAEKGEGSLFDVIRLHRPFVIVDEAHNQRTRLAVDTLAAMRPCCVLELTATPDREENPPNVLRYVPASVLQAEDMIKLPIELTTHESWEVTLNHAIAKRNDLEKAAEEECKKTGEIIAPIVMLLQADKKSADKTTQHAQWLKNELISTFHIPENQIAIATGEKDELGDKKSNTPDYPRYIITVDKLREGWDCPSAYILFSLRNSTSPTAVEQILGRILRMPHAKKKINETLNCSYAFAVSDSLSQIAHSLRDGLILNGFEKFDADKLIKTSSKINDFFRQDMPVAYPQENGQIIKPDPDKFRKLPSALRDKIEQTPEEGHLTIPANLSDKEIEKIADTFSESAAKDAFKKEYFDARDAFTREDALEQTPSQKGVKAKIPLLSVKQFNQTTLFNETSLIDGDWSISSFDYHLTESDFPDTLDALRRAELRINKTGEDIDVEFYDRQDANFYALSDAFRRGNEKDLIMWLDKELLFYHYEERQRKIAWITKAILDLMETRKLSLDNLFRLQFRLRDALKRKLDAGLKRVKQQTFAEMLNDDSQFLVNDEHTVEFKQGCYPANTQYTGFVKLKRHFFPIIGNLKNKGEEFDCAMFIANDLEGVDWWVRNIERQPTSFRLHTSSDWFYPDFVIKMQSGLILVVEYKGENLLTTDDSKEKRFIGELWAKRSNGKCRFVMASKHDYKEAIRKAAT
jgi:type III restriction enzyme